MSLPAALAAVVDLQHSHRELLRVVDALKPGDWFRGVPYGEWTVKDLIAYCIGDMSPSGPGLIAAGVLTPEFIAETSRAFDVRARNQEMVAERRRYTPEDLRQLLFEAHDARIEATLRLDESHLEALAYPVPMGEGYEIQVFDWLWYGYHDREHADDIRRALEIDWKPRALAFIPEIEAKLPVLIRAYEGFLRAAYSVADDAWAEPSSGCPGWTYHDIVAHISSNETGRRARLFRAVLGEGQIDDPSLSDIDGWNEAAVAERRDWPIRKLIDEYAAAWDSIRESLAAFRPEHLESKVEFTGVATLSIAEFLDRMGGHVSGHAGQLVGASRARRHSH